MKPIHYRCILIFNVVAIALIIVGSFTELLGTWDRATIIAGTILFLVSYYLTDKTQVSD